MKCHSGDQGNSAQLQDAPFLRRFERLRAHKNSCQMNGISLIQAIKESPWSCRIWARVPFWVEPKSSFVVSMFFGWFLFQLDPCFDRAHRWFWVLLAGAGSNLLFSAGSAFFSGLVVVAQKRAPTTPCESRRASFQKYCQCSTKAIWLGGVCLRSRGLRSIDTLRFGRGPRDDVTLKSRDASRKRQDASQESRNASREAPDAFESFKT